MIFKKKANDYWPNKKLQKIKSSKNSYIINGAIIFPLINY